MAPLSLIIITRDEADRIPAAIRSAPFVSEVIVVDSGSTDGTVEVARSLGARVVQTDWPGHVAQKNRAWALATQPWVLSLDADERLSPELAEAIVGALKAPPEAVVGFSALRVNDYLGQRVKGGVFGPAWHLRLARREAGVWVGEDPHDRLEARGGAVVSLPGVIEHTPYRSLNEHMSTVSRYSARFIEVALASGRRAGLSDVLLRPILHLVSSLTLRGGFRDGALGWQLAWIGAAQVAMRWAGLYRAQREPKPPPPPPP
jgi:glycosyltransferase involved in cell wall biosynthesis